MYLFKSATFLPKSIFVDFSITFSSTKMGAPALNARAIASLGRASIVIETSSFRICMVAKKVLSAC